MPFTLRTESQEKDTANGFCTAAKLCMAAVADYERSVGRALTQSVACSLLALCRYGASNFPVRCLFFARSGKCPSRCMTRGKQGSIFIGSFQNRQAMPVLRHDLRKFPATSDGRIASLGGMFSPDIAHLGEAHPKRVAYRLTRRSVSRQRFCVGLGCVRAGRQVAKRRQTVGRQSGGSR